MAESNILDAIALQQLMECVGNDWDFLAELADEFYKDTPSLMQQAQQARQAGDAEELRRAAHSLKSNAANFGAREMARMCKELEDMGKAGSLEGAELQLEQIAGEFARVKEALEVYVQQGRADTVYS